MKKWLTRILCLGAVALPSAVHAQTTGIASDLKPSTAMPLTTTVRSITLPTDVPAAPVASCESKCCETRKGCFFVFGEYLYWNVHNVDVPYAQPFDGVIPGLAAPRGAVAVVSPEYNSGFRLGGGVSAEEGSWVTGTFTYFRTDRSSEVAADAGLVLRNLLSFPNTINAAVDSTIARADYRIELMMADIDYRCALVSSDHVLLNWVAGIRFAHIDQRLEANYLITGETTVVSAIDFDGIGPRIGLDGQYRIRGGFYGYSQGFIDLLMGQFRASSEETNIFTGSLGQTSIKSNRMVPILELEIGAGWQSASGNIRVAGGYYVGSWLNTVTMTGLSSAITGTNFTTNGNNLRDSTVFDGLVLRAEFRY